MNHEQAARCLQRSRKHLQEGDCEQALSLAEKSVRLHDTAEGRAWLERVRSLAARGTASGRCPSSASAASEDGKHAMPSASSGPNGTASGSRVAAAAASDEGGEQDGGSARRSAEANRAAIRRIVNASSLYSVLSVERDATEADIRRAYRQLALRFHPDKNADAQADSAFKRIAHAFQVLSDARRRQMYDQTGAEDEQSLLLRQRQEQEERYVQMRRRGGRAAHPFAEEGFGAFHGTPFGTVYFGNSNGDEMSAEELFEAFFFGGLSRGPGVRMYSSSPFMRRYRSAPPPDSGGRGGRRLEHLRAFLHLIPFILFFVLPSVIALLSPKPAFQLDPSSGHTQVRVTDGTRLEYFVDAHAYDKMSEAQRLSVQRDVEQEWLRRYATACRVELRQREELRELARRAWMSASRRRYEAAAEAMSMAGCRAYEHLHDQLSGKGDGGAE
ncbi:hypothetical protein CDCA_CDCA10G2892 [Cyanidium caldarium]|uniref:J domain-containing protein n=1 Tax=Cyanidium caldarium TaxID=2771 RepID=A0AAV9IX10_CYACA|nr:hypothetical protein CDCA_CDCA10G2892 [Cyanidium caldarium]